MSLVMVRYKVKPDRVAENEELVRAVYAELDKAKPAGLRYVTFQLDDGATFVHIAQHPADAATNPLTELPAFQRFQAHINDRCEQAPTATPIREIGSYRIFHD
ncbi:MAG TPA: hypothetical protein VF223_13555 [Trebonia sp.]|jgi:hypothetical protein